MTVITPEPVALLSQLDDRAARELERLFKALADQHRIKILSMLGRAEEPVCVCEFVEALGRAQATVSYHLKQLVDAGLISREQRGSFAHYRLVPGALDGLAARVTGK
jgi:ArsR family transcriptional regulator